MRLLYYNRGMSDRLTVWTVGHSTHPLERFLELLRGERIEIVADVRHYPGSRRHPQFGKEALRRALAEAGLRYEHMEALGGRRTVRPDSPNTAWRHPAFRGYADYMQTADFEANLASLIELARGDRVAIMCAEALPWRCHRSLIADALVVHGVSTCEIASPTRLQPHKVTPFAYVQGTEITYPRAASNTSVAAHEPGSDGSDVHRRKP